MRSLGFLVVIGLLVVLVSPLLAQGSNVIINGGFDSGLLYWYRTSPVSGFGFYSTLEGRSVLGSYSPGFVYLLSTPFRGSTGVSFWMKKHDCSWAEVGILDWFDGQKTRLARVQDCDTYAWQQYTYTLNYPADHWLSFYVVGHDNLKVYYDDFEAFGGELVYRSEYINGRFGDLSYWSVFDACGLPYLDVTVGNPPPSVRGDINCRNTLVSMPLYVVSADWVIDLRCGVARNDVELYLSYSGTLHKVADLSCGVSWTRSSVSLSSHVNRYASVVVTYPSNGHYVWIDNVCPASGCMDAYPSPTPTLMPTSSYPTIDWSRFPTYPPFPTFPAFPTAMYGPGTPVPVTGVVKIDDTTPVAVRIDDRTPVRVTFGDMVYTPVSYKDVSISRGQLSGSGGIPTVINHPSQSSISYGTGGSTENPVRFELASEQWSFTLPGLPGISEPITVIMDYYYPSAFVVAGVDMLPAIYTLGAVFVVAFIIHRLKER